MDTGWNRTLPDPDAQEGMQEGEHEAVSPFTPARATSHATPEPVAPAYTTTSDAASVGAGTFQAQPSDPTHATAGQAPQPFTASSAAQPFAKGPAANYAGVFSDGPGSLRTQQQESLRGEHAAVEVAPERYSTLRGCLSLLIMLAIVLGAAAFLRTFIIAPYEIPSGSMESTIMIQDKVFSEKVSYYMHGVNPGDIVTFIDPEDERRTLIKRCIATGGQTVDLIDGVVHVDGVALDEPYTRGLPSDPIQPTAPGVVVEFPYTIPEGYIWVMGDNRTNSADSRYFGAVPESSVTGHACFIYWPFDRAGVLE